MKEINTAVRTDAPEIMDDFELKGSELRQTLQDLNRVNKLLGGDRISIKGLKKLLSGIDKKEINIADVGCGNGAFLRHLAKWGRTHDYSFSLTGIDANPYAVEIAREQSSHFSEIKYLSIDVFEPEFRNLEFDMVICTLTLHHFKDEQLIELMNYFYDQSKIGVVINDLHRSSFAYRSFQAFCSVFINNEIARKDGLTSILRGFKRKDLENYKKFLPPAEHFISWEWAFRYLWIVKKRII
ncbi:methyltransferase [Christiangramia fulva]|uniref:Methyltransferase n=1 Tax=Christiangramia fulva TaxID=2126553 RepID=A0A2R3Z7W8_9FLAO|nr:methyltransferase domain-containing protein [Christiangramia fulva]AVR46371.1 methyltransferase [Christiangramia fulva]